MLTRVREADDEGSRMSSNFFGMIILC